MSGYKRTIQELKPAGFWSFDGEPYDPTTRLFTHSPLVMFDESSTGQDGLLMVGSELPDKSYRAGMASLVALEPAQQQCISFGHYGVVNTVLPKALVQVPHNQAFTTTSQYGSFAVQFLLMKPNDETVLRNTLTAYQYSDHPRYIFHKPGLLTFVLNDRWSYEDVYQVTFPNGTGTIPASAIPGFYNTTHHIVCNWDVKREGQGYTGTATVYVDGVIVYQLATVYADTFPVTTVNLPIEIGGRSDVAYPHDRATSATHIDAVALWARALKPVEVYRLFKKIWQYIDMVKKKAPVLMVNMQDDYVANSTTVYQDVPSDQSLYVNQTGNVVRAKSGPSNIPGSRSFLFNNAMLMIRNQNNMYPQPVTIDKNNYAIEFWSAPATSDRAVLFSMQGKERPFSGPLVELNCDANGAWANGRISFTEADGVAVATPAGVFYNNGTWHHILVQRRAGEFMEIFVDGKLVVSERKAVQSIPAWPADINLMGAAPGRLSTNGYMAYFAMYTGKTFTEYEVTSRYSYAAIYRVRGNTTLRGVPYRARVRLYDYISGKLIDEMDSATTDGLFQFYLKDNSLVNAFVAAMNDQNVRVRAFGPLVPAEIPDLPTG